MFFFQVPEVASEATGGARRLEFSAEEKAYIAQKKEIILGVDPNWMPFEALDENGDYVGIGDDFYALFSELTGLQFTVLKTSTWDETLEKAKNREVDVVSMAALTPERQQYLSFTPSLILEVESVIATLYYRPNINDLDEIPGKRIGVIKGYSHVELLGNKYPEIEIIEINDYHDGLLMVQSGDLYGLGGNMASLGYAIQKYKFQNVKIAGTVGDVVQLRIGTRNDEPILASIFEKLVSSVTDKERQDILNKWVGIRYETVVDYSVIWKIGIGVLVLIVIFTIWLLAFKKLNRRLSESNKQLEELNRQKDYYLSVMAHDLRNPFMILMGYSNMLKDDFDSLSRDEIKDYITRIHDSTELIQEMLDNLMEWAKIELNNVHHTLVAIDVYASVKSIVALYSDYARQKDISIRNEIPVALIRNFDKHMILTILRNLVNNAVKYSLPGTTVTIGFTEGENECIWVNDQGVGMSATLIESLQKEEPRKSKPGTDAETGTGLGLLISYRYAREMGMKLQAESSPEKGTTFRLII